MLTLKAVLKDNGRLYSFTRNWVINSTIYPKCPFDNAAFWISFLYKSLKKA